MSRPQFIIFDLDGTLADSQAGILYSFHATLSDRGRSASDDELRGLIGPPLGRSFARLGFADGEIDEVVALYRRYYDQGGVDLCHLYAGVQDLLEQLRRDGVALGVATAKRVDFASRMLANLGILGHFACVSGVSLDGRLTTKSEIVGEALELLGESPSAEGWMVGDRREDILAAIEHSLVPVGALWGYGSPDELAESGAQLLAASPRGLLGLVRGE